MHAKHANSRGSEGMPHRQFLKIVPSEIESESILMIYNGPVYNYVDEDVVY